MTDRTKGLIVLLDDRYRTDDAQAIVDAILMLKGVVSVEFIVDDATSQLNKMDIREQDESKIMAALKELRP